MIYRENKKNKDQISQLGFGCMRFPGKGTSIDIPRSADMVHAAIEKGVNYFDTAYIYPGSEAAIGQILQGGWRERVNLATKLPLIFTREYSDFDKFFSIQLKRLKTDYIDYYLLHMLTDFGQFKKFQAMGIEQWAESKKKEGHLKNFGFSFHGSRTEFKKIIDAYGWDFCMIQYNYLDEDYQAGTEGLKYAASKGIPVIVMEPLRGGKLVAGLGEKALHEFKAANPERSPAEWGLRWVWNHPEVLAVLSGMSNDAQVEENIRVASDARPESLTQAESDAYKRVLAVLRKNIKVNCTGCGYCMPCPAGVDIPHCFMRYNDSAIVSKAHNVISYMMSAGVIPSKTSYASQCKKCGKCEQHCPQGIKIIESLEQSARCLEPFWLKTAAKIAKRFTVGK